MNHLLQVEESGDDKTNFYITENKLLYTVALVSVLISAEIFGQK